MKKFKMVLCITLTMIMLLSSNAFAYASSNGSIITDATQYVENYFNEKGQANILKYLRGIMTDQQIASQLFNKSMFSTRMNEYLKVKELQAIPNTKLKEMGYKDEEIKELKQKDYKKMALEFKEMSYKELKEKGFSDEKINALRSYDGSEQALAALTSNCDVIVWYDTDYSYYSTSADRTYVKIQYNWFWDGYPWGYKSSDIMSFTWSEFMYLTSASNATCTIGYKTHDDSKFLGFRTQSVSVNDPVGSCYFEFPFETSINGYDGYAQNGAGVINISKSGRVYEIGLIAGYGHTTEVLGSPSVTFGNPPSLSLTYSTCMVKTDQEYIYLSTIPVR